MVGKERSFRQSLLHFIRILDFPKQLRKIWACRQNERMNRIEHPSAEALARLELLLGLKPNPCCQDWDIGLADPQRIAEFLDLYEGGTLSEVERFALMELVVASFDELLGLTGAVGQIWRRIRSHLMRERTLHEATIEYWSCDEPDSGGGFLVTPYIRQLNAIHSATPKGM
jgi:hypothetical protein